MVMIDPERIQRLAAKMGNRKDALEMVHQMRCGGKKYPGGGKFFRTSLQNESPLMYQPILPSVPDVPTPMRYEPQPHLGLYEYPSTTGMAESYPVTLPPRVSVTVSRNVSVPEVVEAPVENLFSDEMIARRALKQRYAESAFNDKAKSNAGAQGAWQIMPITLKDYLGRGRGKAGDLNDPAYNRKVRDWVMGIIPRDLQEFWSDSDSDRAKLAKLYAAYNWGAGNLRGFLRKKQKAGVDISNPDNWVDDLNPETRRYVKYLAFDEDIPDSTVYTNAAFEKAAAERGYADGGSIRIKPSHRGRLTELKARTGKSEAELYNDGNPAHKKMVVFARNARKWKHGDGGFMNKYDGETEETGWLRRLLNTPTMVPNMTGTATAAATGLRDIPLTESTVGNELAVAGTALASPFVISSPQFAGNAVNWLSNPANQILAAKFTVPMLGAEAVNSAVRNYTPYNSWGQGLYAPIHRFSDMIDEKTGAHTPQFFHDAMTLGLDFTNPGFIIAPYAGEITRNIGKGVKDLYRWGRFVTGNGEDYAHGLRRMKALQDEAEAVHNDVAELQRSALANQGSYELPVQPNTVEIAGGNGAGIESETLLDFSPYSGSNIYRIPQYVDELGSSGNATLTYPVAATPVTRNHVNAMKLPYRGSPNIFDAYDSFIDASGNSWHYPYDPLPRIEYKYVGDNGLTTSLLKYDAGSGSSIPVQRGAAGGGKKIAESMAHTESILGDSGFVSGSTRFYAEDMLSGVPKDTEIVTTQGKFNDVLSKLEIKNPTKINDFAYEGNSMSLPNSGKVDIQIIEQNSAGEANGSLSWSLFKTMHPKEYHQLVNDYAYGRVGSMSSNVPFKDMPVINPSTGRAYTPDELYAEFTSGDFKMQQLVNDAMGMNKDIRNSFAGNPKDNLLKHNRPLSFLTNKDPHVKALVRRALDTNAEAELGDNFVHGTQYFPSIDFTNVAENEAFLKSFGINPNGIADDPDMMSNIFDAWFLPESTQVRVVSGMRGKDAVRKALFEGNHSYGGGSAAGSGLNTLEGGVPDLAFPYSQTGFMQNLPSYGTVRDDITSPMAAKNLVTRLNRKSMLSADEQSALKKELNSIISDLQAQHAPSNVMNTLNSIKMKMGTTQSLVRFDEHLTMIGDYIPDPYAEEIIDRWTRAIDLPGMKTGGYGGTYYGKFRKGAPSATSVKIVDPYAKYGDRNPFEVGRNLRTYSKNNSGSSSSYTGVGVERAVSRDQIPVEGRDIAASMIKPYANMMTPEQLDALGAEFTPNPDVARFQERTQKLLDQKWEHGLLGEELERLEKLPMSSRVIRKAEERTGLRRDKFVRDSKVTEFIPSSVKREMLKDAPFDTKNLRILGFKPMPEVFEFNSETGEITKKAMDGFMVQLTDGTEYEVTKQVIDGKTKWVWNEYVLPFAKGGFMNRLKSVYHDNNDKILQAIANARSRQKK